jgi:hypothetical protein
MVAQLHSAWVGSLLAHMPGPVLTALNRWAERVARRRGALRRQAWLQRQQARRAVAPGSAPAPSYRLQPWRD